MNNAVSSGRGRLSDDEVLRAVPPLSGAREFRVGVFVILGIVGFFTVLYLMTAPALFRGRYMVVTEVADAHGIRRGDPVRMRGINIGRVYSFDLAPTGGVYITLELEEAYPIPGEARAELLSTGFLGGMVVSIVPGASERYVEPGDVIPGTMIGGVLDTAGDLALDASDLMDRVQRLLADSTIAGTGEAVASLRDLLEDLAEVTDGQVAQLQGLTESLHRSAANVEDITGAGEWSAALASAEGTMASAENAMAALERTSNDVAESVGSLNVILARIENGEGTLGKLSATDDLHSSLDAMVNSLRELLEDIQANPSRYVTIEIF